MGWCGLGPREGGWVENEGALEGAVPVGSEGRTGVWLSSGSVAGPSKHSRLYLRVLETPEEPLGCGGFHVHPCPVHTTSSSLSCP